MWACSHFIRSNSHTIKTQLTTKHTHTHTNKMAAKERKRKSSIPRRHINWFSKVLLVYERFSVSRKEKQKWKLIQKKQQNNINTRKTNDIQIDTKWN